MAALHAMLTLTESVHSIKGNKTSSQYHTRGGTITIVDPSPPSLTRPRAQSHKGSAATCGATRFDTDETYTKL